MNELDLERRRRRIARLADEQRYARICEPSPPRDFDAEEELAGHTRNRGSLGGAWVAQQRGLVGRGGDLPRSRR